MLVAFPASAAVNPRPPSAGAEPLVPAAEQADLHRAPCRPAGVAVEEDVLDLADPGALPVDHRRAAHVDDLVELESQSGQDLSIGFDHHDADRVHLYLEESFSFRAATPEAACALLPAE
jgi:hypothetical protein